MVKILGILDLFGAALFLAIFYKVEIPHGLINLIAVCLIIKGLIFLMDFSSIIDVMAGILLLISLSVNVPSLILLSFALFIGFKGVMSLPAT